jgi:hypothetical protein
VCNLSLTVGLTRGVLQRDRVRWVGHHLVESGSDVAHLAQYAPVSDEIPSTQSWRFVVPTISDDLPPLYQQPRADSVSVLSIPSDTWRQVDLISPSLLTEVDAILNEVTRIRVESRGGPGYLRVHARRGLAEPLSDVSISVGELEN